MCKRTEVLLHIKSESFRITGLPMTKKITKKKRKTTFYKPMPVWGWIAIAVVILAMAGFVIFQQKPQPAAPVPTTIDVARASQLRDQGAFILDVREPSEWAQFHIPGANLIPLGSLPGRLNEVPKNRQVVVVCRTGIRSAQGRDILLKAGFTKVTSMTGGMNEWQAQGLPVATGQ
jgi:rhodanese-related sulfurtransferase